MTNDNEETTPMYPSEPPTYHFNAWELAAAATTTTAGLFSVVGQGLNLVAAEFYSFARQLRNDQVVREYELRRAREAAEMARTATILKGES